jgi:hypothetical protein
MKSAEKQCSTTKTRKTKPEKVQVREGAGLWKIFA